MPSNKSSRFVCGVLGCGAALAKGNKTGVCHAHPHAAGVCQCRLCRPRQGKTVDPAEPPGVENLTATIIGPRGERLVCPDWLVPLLAGGDDDWLLTAASEAREDAAYEAAESRRDVA